MATSITITRRIASSLKHSFICNAACTQQLLPIATTQRNYICGAIINRHNSSLPVTHYETVQSTGITRVVPDECENDMLSAQSPEMMRQDMKVKTSSEPVVPVPRIRDVKKTGKESTDGARKFLEQVTQQKKIPSGSQADSSNQDRVIALQAKQILMELSRCEANYENGPLASRILDAVIHRKRPRTDEEKALFSKLHSLTMQVWISSGHRLSAYEVESLFWKLIANKDEFLTANLKLNVDSFNDAFCLTVNAITYKTRRRALSDAVSQRVNAIITTMKRLWNDNNVLLSPNTPACNAILFTLMKQRNYEMAVSMLDSMIDTWQKGDERMRPNLSSFDAAIVACSKAGQPDAAMKIIQDMIELNRLYPDKIPFPGPFNFTDLLNAIAQCQDVKAKREAGERAEKIVQWIQDLHDSGKHKVLDGRKSMTYNINCVMKAWANTDLPDSSHRVHKILQNMLQKYHDIAVSENTNDDNNRLLTRKSDVIYPDSYSFSIAILSWYRTALRASESGDNKTLDSAVTQGLTVTKWMVEFIATNSDSVDLKKAKFVFEDSLRLLLLQKKTNSRADVQNDCNQILNYMQQFRFDTSIAYHLMNESGLLD